MKKALTIFLAAVLMLSMAACGGDSDTPLPATQENTIGDTAKSDVFEIVLSDAEFAREIVGPESITSVYDSACLLPLTETMRMNSSRYITADDGYIYLSITLNLKNIGKTATSVTSQSLELDYNDGYKYQCKELMTNWEELWISSGEPMEPLSPNREFRGYFEVPLEVKDNLDAPLLLNIAGVQYNIAEARESEKEQVTGVSSDDLKDIRNKNAYTQGIVSSSESNSVGLKADGTVVAVGSNSHGQCDVSDWTDIVAIEAGLSHTVGLKADGTIVAVGYNEDGRCDVSDWTNIIAVAAGTHTVGLKEDGTVVAAGLNKDGQCDVSEWKDIVAIAAGYSYTIGLKADGTVVAVGNNENGKCNVSDWVNIVAISAGQDHTVGLKADGTVIAIGKNPLLWSGTSNWNDIIAISAGHYYTVGLKADGTVVATGSLTDKEDYNVSEWKDIVAIAAGGFHAVGLKSDGSVVIVGDEWDVTDWKLK